MRVRRQSVCCGAVIVLALSAATASANVFSMPDGLTSLSFVPVGDANNVADATGYGSVNHSYQMGTYDVTVGQYCEFLNAVAKDDTHGLYNNFIAMGITTKDNASGLYLTRITITQTGGPGNYSYAVGGTNVQAANCPMYAASWADAARFANWVQNGQPSYPAGTPGEVAGSTETGAYTLNGINDNPNLMKVTRNPGAEYFIPTLDEWYKAAYYKGNGTDSGYWLYPMQSSSPPNNVLSATTPNSANYFTCGTCSTDIVNRLTPVGAFLASPGPYGTYDQGGNINQWTETPNAGGTMYNARGGDWDHYYTALSSGAQGTDNVPLTASAIVGFRLAASAEVPEPGTIALLLAAAIGLLSYVWRRTGTEQHLT
jgi:formylglycine-generating enzyme